MKKYFLGLSRTKKIVAVLIVIFVAWGAYKLWFSPANPSYDLATAARGDLTQVVSVTGNTAPVHQVDLAFENAGTVAAVNAAVGAQVAAGQVIARLDTSDLLTQLAQAKANVDAQTAQLNSLMAGSRPEDIETARANAQGAEQALTNLYANVPSTLADAFAKSNDAVRNQLAPFFSGAETNNPELSFQLNNSQTLNNVQFDRLQAGTELNNWQSELAAINTLSPTSTLDAALQAGNAHLVVINNLLIAAGEAIVDETSLTAATLASYKTALAAALTEENSATTEVSAAVQNISSQEITIQGLQATLSKEIAGPTTQDIAAQQAQVEQAQANADNINVKIAKASLTAPVSGVITVQNAVVGEIASPGVVLTSMISDQGLEVDAQIAEADIGKVAVGDPAVMTLDAFQGRTFSGKVTYIDPGETDIEGVPTYKTTFQFDNLDNGVKPGMTANIDITTAVHKNVIYVPQRDVITAADGTRSVQVYHGAGQPLETRTVTVGIRDENGNIEITSGLKEGEVVVRPSQ